MSTEELLKLQEFTNQMKVQLENNSHKGTIFDFKNFESIITELEYHKAKMFLAIRTKEWGAVKEYIADQANFLLALYNMFDLYDLDNSNIAYEINKQASMFIIKPIDEQSKDQSII